MSKSYIKHLPPGFYEVELGEDDLYVSTPLRSMHEPPVFYLPPPPASCSQTKLPQVSVFASLVLLVQSAAQALTPPPPPPEFVAAARAAAFSTVRVATSAASTTYRAASRAATMTVTTTVTLTEMVFTPAIIPAKHRPCLVASSPPAFNFFKDILTSIGMTGHHLIYKVVKDCYKAISPAVRDPEFMPFTLDDANAYFNCTQLTPDARAFSAKERVKMEHAIYCEALANVKTCLGNLAIPLGIAPPGPFQLTSFCTSVAAQTSAKAKLSNAMDALFKAHNVWQTSLTALKASEFSSVWFPRQDLPAIARASASAAGAASAYFVHPLDQPRSSGESFGPSPSTLTRACQGVGV